MYTKGFSSSILFFLNSTRKFLILKIQDYTLKLTEIKKINTCLSRRERKRAHDDSVHSVIEGELLHKPLTREHMY